jgi:single-strand selective monofunctional uracil DNA glycosylase
VPFGDIKTVKEWLKVTGKVHPPKKQHPKRPIEGMQVKKREVSGQRLWGLFQAMAGSPEVFFKHCLVYNYCPLCFIDSTGKNLAPNNLSPAERSKLTSLCDEAMRDIIQLLQPHTLVGVGKWTEDRLNRIQKEFNLSVRVVGIMHPSPLNSRANTDFSGKVRAELDRLQLSKYVMGQADEDDSSDTSYTENAQPDSC